MKVLIANRGEIAVRIIRACQELAIPTVAVYSTADRESLHAQLADEAVCIGNGPSSESYLNITAVLSAAMVTGATAIHPGFGFLSENDHFARACAECGLVFIGPTPETIATMGDKIMARTTMRQLGVPVIPGSAGVLTTVEEAEVVASEVGYPVMIKAAAGGGGKGMRKVNRQNDLKAHFQAAQKEALAAFGNGDLYLEKIIYPAKHIEVQVLGDGCGHVVHFGERDCSLQRRHQKVLEEAPASALKEKTRAAIRAIAVKAASGVDYLSCGTIEFLVDQSENIYFMEMNTRIQVEHPITEMITGVDLVKQQLKLAQGQKLSLQQADIHFSGHAIECRINAENPRQNFMPNAGTIEELFLPLGTLGLRIDSGIYQGYRLPSFYDSMLAKIIVHAPTREEAIMKMQRALNELEIEGVVTNQELHQDLITDDNFVDNQYDTAFLEETFLPNWLANL